MRRYRIRKAQTTSDDKISPIDANISVSVLTATLLSKLS